MTQNFVVVISPPRIPPVRPLLLCFYLLQRDPNDIMPARAAEPPCVSSSGRTLTFFTLQIFDLLFSVLPGLHQRDAQPRYIGKRWVMNVSFLS
jgi:hypothetical protein